MKRTAPKRTYGDVRTVVIKKADEASAAHISPQVTTSSTPVAPVGASVSPELPPLAFRLMGIDDAAFVIDSFCNSYRHSRDMRAIPPDIFKIEMRAWLRDFIPGKRVLVVGAEGHATSIFGWCMAEPPREAGGLWIIHYILVKPEWQRKGLATQLMAPFRDASPQRMCWATMETDALRFLGKDFLILNKFLLWKTGPLVKPVPVGGIGPW